MQFATQYKNGKYGLWVRLTYDDGSGDGAGSGRLSCSTSRTCRIDIPQIGGAHVENQ